MISKSLLLTLMSQSDLVNASVTDDGRIQLFVAEPDLDGAMSISGGLASELGIKSEGRATSVQDISLTERGLQNAISVIDSAMKYVDSQRADLGAKQTV